MKVNKYNCRSCKGTWDDSPMGYCPYCRSCNISVTLNVDEQSEVGFEQQVIPTEANVSCENCKYEEFNDKNGSYCKKHSGWLEDMFPNNDLKLSELGCKQFEQIVSAGSE